MITVPGKVEGLLQAVLVLAIDLQHMYRTALGMYMPTEENAY